MFHQYCSSGYKSTTLFLLSDRKEMTADCRLQMGISPDRNLSLWSCKGWYLELQMKCYCITRGICHQTGMVRPKASTRSSLSTTKAPHCSPAGHHRFCTLQSWLQHEQFLWSDALLEADVLQATDDQKTKTKTKKKKKSKPIGNTLKDVADFSSFTAFLRNNFDIKIQ